MVPQERIKIMIDEKEIAKRVIEMRTNGKDYGLVELPGFKIWCNNKSSAGANEDAIDSMLSMSMFLLPGEIVSINEKDYNEIYEEIVEELNE